MAAALQEGDVFAGRYRITRELASGGMGAVYEVVHSVTERRCALKVMLAHTVEREILRKRFMQESRLAAQIGSEYIVDVLDAGVDEETKAPYLVMELLEGEDLGQRLLRVGPLSRSEAVLYLSHVALALDRTHQAGIVHRDLKASNLFLTHREDGSPLVKVLDFGVAKVLTLERSGEQRTQTVGTPIYMAPEQFRAEGRISPSTDIYALGMLSYTLLVGVHYWREEHEKCENPFAFAGIAVDGPKEPPSLRAAAEGVTLPESFDVWFRKATSRWPQDRFGSAGEAVAALADALGVEAPLPASSAVPKSLASSGATHEQVHSTPGVPSPMEGPSRRTGSTGSGRSSAGRAGTPSRPLGTKEPTGGSDSLDGGHHTEVSLSVTSGGLAPPIERKPAPRARTPWMLIALGVAAGVLAVGIARTLTTTPVARELGARTAVPATAAPVPAPSATTASPEPPAAPPASASAAPEPADTSVIQVDDLPLAAPAAARKAKKQRTAPRVVAPAPAPVTAPAAPDRSSTWGRE